MTVTESVEALKRVRRENEDAPIVLEDEQAAEHLKRLGCGKGE